jgi:hypothetical protein
LVTNSSLRKLEDDCNEDINRIIQKLMDNNAHDLCYKLLKVFNKYDQYKNEVKFSEIKLLLSTNNIHNKIQALEKLEKVDGDVNRFLSRKSVSALN